MKIKLLALSMLVASLTSAQDLVPYQVQDIHHWDQNKLWGYKKTNFEVAIPPVNESPLLFSNGYVVLKKNGKYGLMNEKGNIILQPQYRRCSAVENEFIEVEDEYNNNGGYVISLRTKEKFGYDNSMFGTATSLSGFAGLFIVKQVNLFNPSTYGLSDSTGKTVVPTRYNSIEKLVGGTIFGRFRVQDSTKLYGIIDEKGNWLIHPKYDSIGEFKVGLARVCLNKKYGFIDYAGVEVIPVQYDAAADFTNLEGLSAFINDEPAYTPVKQGSEGFFIDDKGNTYFKGKGLKEAISENNKWFIVRANNDSVYIINKDLQPLTPAMNKIVTTDGKNFLMRYGTKAYAANTKAIQEVPLPDVSDVTATPDEKYVITTKAGEKGYLSTVMNNDMKPIFPLVPLYVIYSEDLQRCGLYIANKDGSISLYSFINFEGKEFSDITK